MLPLLKQQETSMNVKLYVLCSFILLKMEYSLYPSRSTAIPFKQLKSEIEEHVQQADRSTLATFRKATFFIIENFEGKPHVRITFEGIVHTDENKNLESLYLKVAKKLLPNSISCNRTEIYHVRSRRKMIILVSIP